jgi:hypothetical protein
MIAIRPVGQDARPQPPRHIGARSLGGDHHPSRSSIRGAHRALPTAPHPITNPHHPNTSEHNPMDRGIDFLRSQVNNAVMQHRTFVENLTDHGKQADDERFRALCQKFLVPMTQHQQMLEDYQREIGAETGTAKKMLGKALGMARDVADAARESDFLRLVGDIVTSRQSEDTFKTFREAGRTLGIQRLAQIGDIGERGHDQYAKEANRLAQQMFVDLVRQGDTTGLTMTPSASTGATDAGLESGGTM